MAPLTRQHASRARALPLALLGAAAVAGVVVSRATMSFSSMTGGRRAARSQQLVHTVAKAGMPGMDGMGGFDTKAMEELMKDPEKLKKLQEEAAKIMEDPEKAKMITQWQEQMQSSVKKLEDDPEMKDFFEDIRKNGLEAMKKYENDERILRKFSMATGGPQNMPGMPGMPGMAPGAPAAGMAATAAPRAFKPGDEVIITGLSKAPELNSRKAMVVPPTAEEQKTLQGTNRLIVRLLDTGDQFAVKPENLRTTAEEVDKLMSNDIEDMAFSNPALQTEAAKLRESGKLDDIQNDPELQPIFADIKKNGMAALEKYWNDEKLMKKINQVMAAGGGR